MITNGESTIRRVIAVNWDGKAMPPCGACRGELMTRLMPESYKDNRSNDELQRRKNCYFRQTKIICLTLKRFWIKAE